MDSFSSPQQVDWRSQLKVKKGSTSSMVSDFQSFKSTDYDSRANDMRSFNSMMEGCSQG